MYRSRIFLKLYAGCVVLILLATGLVGGLTGMRIRRDSLEDIRNSLETRALCTRALVVKLPRGMEDPALQKNIEKLGRDISTRITIISPDGRVAADSEKDPSQMDNHRTRPEILAARSHGKGRSTRLSDTLHMQMMYFALPIEYEGGTAGYVRTALSLSTVNEKLSHLRAVTGLATLLSALAALFLGFIAARHFTKPIMSMTRTAKAIAAGDYGSRMPDGRRDEIGKLAETINTMAESSKKRMETITTDKNKLTAVLSAMVEGVIAVDKDEIIMHINESASGILGVKTVETSGRPLWEIMRSNEIGSLITETLKKNEPAGSRMLLSGSSQNRVIDMHASPLHDGYGKVAGAVVVLHDISELIRLENVRRDFVANASHELKTPITAIRGLAETIIDDPELDPGKRTAFIEKIQSQSMRLSSLLSGLLTISYLESDRPPPETGIIDIREAVSGPVEDMVPQARERGIDMAAHLPDSPVQIRGDMDMLKRAVINLIDNAVKYTGEGGKVDVKVARESNKAVLMVTDNGIGIAASDHERIFERFYRVDKTRSRELGGTGLGLSIVKHIVLSLDGTIDIESEPGSGSIFTLCFSRVSSSE